VLFFNFDLWYSSKDKGDDSTDFLSFGRSLLQMYMASRILIQSSEANKDKFTPFFFVFYPMLCCFLTPIYYVQTKTRWWQHGFLPNVVLFFNSDLWCSSRDKGDDNTDFVSFGRSLPQMSKLKGYLFKAQKWKENFIVFFSFLHCFITISWENI